MKTVFALVLVSQLAFGQAVDAPLVDPPIKDLPPPGRVLELGAGELVPFDATCLDKQQAKRAAKLEAFHRDEAKDLKAGNVILPTPAFIAIVAGAVVLSAAAAAAIAVKVMEKPARP